jgi:hypothetical protein
VVGVERLARDVSPRCVASLDLFHASCVSRWAERFEADGSITKWGDKWDEKFDRYGRGQKLGETWNQGAGGNTSRTWGENHFGNGQVQKFGQSTEGEHWDVTESMDTWYETKAHFGFQDCFNQSYKLRQVGRKKKQQL